VLEPLIEKFRLALADEIATSLSDVRSLSTRPFAATSRYDSSPLDLKEAGKAMRVTDIVTGHYMKPEQMPWNLPQNDEVIGYSQFRNSRREAGAMIEALPMRFAIVGDES
jgi:hypothetical protein